MSSNEHGEVLMGDAVCPNWFGNDGSAPPAENIEVDSYVTTYTGYPSKFTKLNISFDLNLNGSGIYRGVGIEIQHLDPLNNEMYCHYINFTDELTDNDLLTEEDTVRRIFFDCSRPVRPGGEYLIKINTMPSTEKPVFKYYWPPSCFDRKNDVYCQTLEEDLPSVWSPSTYIVDGGGDRRVELIFNLAPYDFDMYLVYLKEKELINDQYQPVSHKPLYCLEIHVKSKNVTSERCPSQETFQFNETIWKENNETMVKIIWTDVREAIYYVEMKPRPTAQGQQCSTNNAVNCYITTRDVIVRARPCKRIPDPCEGEHMTCMEEESEPACFCEKGFEMQNETCIESPPVFETSVAPSGTLPGFATSVEPPGKSKAVIAAVVGSLVGLLAIVFVAWLVCRKPDGSEKNNSFIGTGNTVVDQGKLCLYSLLL
ncbi:uncharacterized protein LOC117108547 [Anneissia japonica]|uniref:uncharacterized protein LOC117108547 n=1 Tax=Anneissia japonica TaxID=1529436 RepID=UPI00142590BA|nr:uncharacterized protein LOC117108547 [Anneissia japonica]